MNCTGSPRNDIIYRNYETAILLNIKLTVFLIISYIQFYYFIGCWNEAESNSTMKSILCVNPGYNLLPNVIKIRTATDEVTIGLNIIEGKSVHIFLFKNVILKIYYTIFTTKLLSKNRVKIYKYIKNF